VKKLAEGESSPTQVCVIQDEATNCYDLATETDELDWVLGQYPTSWRLAKRGEDDALVEEFKGGRRKHHLRWRKLRKNEDEATLTETHSIEKQKGKPHILEVPSTLDGFRSWDVVGMTLGGSGDRLAFALSRQSEGLGGDTIVCRIQAGKLKEWREDYYQRDKTEDAKTLAELVRDNRDDFFETTRRDRTLISLVEAWRNRIDAMKARIGAEQRLRSHLVGKIFCSEHGKYPEGEIELLYEEQRANDRVIQALIAEESMRNREIEKILGGLEVYQELFVPIRGVGPMIAARLIVSIGDIRRFGSKAKLKAFLGVHVMQGGRFGDRGADKQFARRRQGEIANWHPEGRQALYLLADQFNRNPSSEWGIKLREYKVKFRTEHPVVECSACALPWEDCSNENGGKHTRRYSDGHIHKMASWRTVTKFVEWLWREWTALEKKSK
jgi:hypothetical protein